MSNWAEAEKCSNFSSVLPARLEQSGIGSLAPKGAADFEDFRHR